MTAKLYEGTKRLHATPMTRGEYNAYRGWENPASENPADGGYLVEYQDGGKANDSRHAGYISWSPADVFERTYRPVVTTLPVIDPGPDSLEREIQAKADNGPRVTPFEVEAHIRSEFYFTAEQGVLGESELGTRPASWTNLDQVTICVLILTNGTKIVGVNEGPVSRENFKADLGRQYARQKAVDQIWPLLGFRLRDELARPVLTEADALADLAGEPRPT